MRPQASLLLVASLVVAAVLPVPVAAEPQGGPGAWKAIAIEVLERTAVSPTLTVAHGPSELSVFAWYFLRLDGAIESARVIVRSPDGAVVRAAAVGDDPVVSETASSGLGFSSVSSGPRLDPGRYVVVFYAVAENLTHFDPGLSAGAGKVTLLGESSGDEVFAIRPGDGPATLSAAAQRWPVGVQAHVGASGEAAVAGRLVGGIAAYGFAGCSARVDGPGGLLASGCPVHVSADTPGAYRFSVDRHVAAGPGTPEPIAHGADWRMPDLDE